MKYELKNDELILAFEGELNSYNAEAIEKEADGIIKKNTFNKLTFDFSKLTYISSAGLRVVLKFKQIYESCNIIEANLEVYDVFEMTGFTTIMNIKKALKKIDISNANIIGEGYFSTVYRIDKDTIIKVFNRVNDQDQIERELRLAKQAFVLGIPTAISFDIVKVGEKLGVRFEMLDCKSLRDEFRNEPEKYDVLVNRYVNLLKKINETDVMNTILPDCKKFWLKKIEDSKELYDEETVKKLVKLVNTIPDRNTFVHGDCHIKNIMVQGDDLLLIDMDTLSKGHPMFELAAIYCTYVAFNENEPNNSDRFLGVTEAFSRKLYDDIISRYYGKDQMIYDKIRILSYIHMVWWSKISHANECHLIGCRAQLLELIKNINDLVVD